MTFIDISSRFPRKISRRNISSGFKIETNGDKERFSLTAEREKKENTFARKKHLRSIIGLNFLLPRLSNSLFPSKGTQFPADPFLWDPSHFSASLYNKYYIKSPFPFFRCLFRLHSAVCFPFFDRIRVSSHLFTKLSSLNSMVLLGSSDKLAGISAYTFQSKLKLYKIPHHVLRA